MHKYDSNRVNFHSKEDMAGGYQLSKGEHILRSETHAVYEDINDILELYNIKQYIDNELYLKNWTENDITEFKQKVIEYGKIIGRFMSGINNYNFIEYYKRLLSGYIDSFWELINNQKIFKQISSENFETVLMDNPNVIQNILYQKAIVTHYKNDIRKFLLSYPESAEILLSIYGKIDSFGKKKAQYLPDNLTIEEKEDIILSYIDSENSNLNYLQLIVNTRNIEKFKLSDKTRLKAKRIEKEKSEKIFEEQLNTSVLKYGVSISFPENPSKIKEGYLDNLVTRYSYSYNYIKENNDNYTLFINFKILFEYVDNYNRIDLINKKCNNSKLIDTLGIHSENEYRDGISFRVNEMTSHAQIVAYNRIVNNMGKSLENILKNIFTITFKEKYCFANNARLSIPSENTSSFEKVRFLAPEFESVLKQFKLFVEDGEIDFELFQMSSTPSTIKDIPSLNTDKYIYLNEVNKDICVCSDIFFSDQRLLSFVEPFKEKHYKNFFDLLANEEVSFNSYKEYHMGEINYLIKNEYIYIDPNGLIQMKNIIRILILKDLFENEFSSFYHYPKVFQDEAKQMEAQGLIMFESSLFSRQEQSYFNYYLNKSEFTNGLDMRNNYLHGTQADPEETVKHEYSYFTYLKLLILVLLKIEDDLLINKVISKS